MIVNYNYYSLTKHLENRQLSTNLQSECSENKSETHGELSFDSKAELLIVLKVYFYDQPPLDVQSIVY